MKHAKEFVRIMRQLKPLLRQHPPLASMSFEDLCDYLAWYWNNGTLAYVIDEQGAHAVCFCRLFRWLEQFLWAGAHEPCGEFCMLELMVADEPNAMAGIFKIFKDRWGPQKVVMWDRGERTENGTPRMYRWDQFEKLARRLTYGLTEETVHYGSE
jgi:hypothetical protein